MTARFLDDFNVGDTYRTEGITLTEAMIIEFARLYDPQPMHLDKEAAADSIYGGLIASGWQVGALAFRMLVQMGVLTGNTLGSPGVDAVRWTRPVRPGDTIHMVATVAEARPSAKHDDRGVVVLDYSVRNQRDEEVMTYRGVQMINRRPAAA